MDFKFMNALLRQDISDIAQVNIPSWTILGWVNEWSFAWIKQIQFTEAQGLLSVVLLLLTILFTAFKFWRAIKHHQWAKQDRIQEVIKEQVSNE